MVRKTFALAVLFGVATAHSQPVKTNSRPSIAPVLYEGARLIPGDGSQPIASSAILVEEGMITKIGAKGSVNAPVGASRVDLTGKTVMPTLIDAHAHPGFQRALTYGADNFTRESIMDDLNRALYFGVAVVQSQGIEKGEVTYQIRADQEAGTLGGARLRIAGRGIGAPNAGPGGAAYAGIAYEVTTEDQGRTAVRELAAKKVNLIKIWVDDRNGRAPSLPRDIFSAIIDEGHKHGLQVNAHVFYHADAVDLVNAGVDSLVHLVRDKEMDDALVASIVRNNVYVMPNLSPERSTYTELPHWLKDGDPLMKLMQESVSQPVIERIRKAYQNRDPAAVERTRTQYAILQRSTAKLAKANAKIALGCDTGLEDHLFGVAEQHELESMVKAGMTPMQVIVAATSRSAEYLKLDKMGALAPGKQADFLVLDANPLDDIANTQRISKMYIKGAEVDRASLRPSLTRTFIGTTDAQTLSGDGLVSALRHGGSVIVMRHASSPREVPDKQTANADNVNQERQLDQDGRTTAIAMGKALRELKIPVGDVFSSPTYRAMETVRLAQLANARPQVELGDGGQSMQGVAQSQAAWLQKKVTQFPSGTNTILVTHQPNMAGAFPQFTAGLVDGEALIFGSDGNGGAALTARVKIEEWPGMQH